MLPCSEVHWKILPAICRELARCMEKEGMARVKIADALGITPSAITQYLGGKRGKEVKLSTEAKKACASLACKIVKSRNNKVCRKEVEIGISRIVAIVTKDMGTKFSPCAACMGIEKNNKTG